MGNISEQKRTKATTSWQSPSVYSIYPLLNHVIYMRPMLKVTYAFILLSSNNTFTCP